MASLVVQTEGRRPNVGCRRWDSVVFYLVQILLHFIALVTNDMDVATGLVDLVNELLVLEP